MAAVIGPVGIQYADLGHGWISFFFAAEVVLDMQEVFEGHGKARGNHTGLLILPPACR